MAESPFPQGPPNPQTPPPGAPPQQAPPPPPYAYGAPQRPAGPYPGGPAPMQPPPMGYAPVPYGPPPGGPPRPPYGPPPQAPGGRKLKRSPWPLVFGLVILVIVVLPTLLILVGLGVSGNPAGGGASSSGLLFGSRIAVLDVEGVIGEGPGYFADSKTLKKLVDEWAEDDRVKGMVVRLNTPGGAVAPTEDVYQALQEFRAKGKPVYASMGSVAASGGYYLAAGSERVWSNGGTITGSIGVILSFLNYEGLQEKIGVDSRVVKSGEFKDIGSGSRPMTPEEQALLDEMVADVFDQFFKVVYDARRDAVEDLLQKETPDEWTALTPEQRDERVREYIMQYTDGRIFSGQQAYELGFVDEMGTFDDAFEALRLKLKLPEDVGVVRGPQRPQGLFGSMKSRMNQIEQQITGSPVQLEYRLR